MYGQSGLPDYLRGITPTSSSGNYSQFPPLPTYNSVRDSPQQYLPIQPKHRPGLPSYEQVAGPPRTSQPYSPSNTYITSPTYQPHPGVVSFSKQTTPNPSPSPAFSPFTSGDSIRTSVPVNQTGSYSNLSPAQIHRVQQQVEEEAKRQEQYNLAAQQKLQQKLEQEKKQKELEAQKRQQEELLRQKEREMEEQIKKEKEAFQREQEMKFQRMWAEREAEWKKKEQEQMQRQQELENQARLRRIEEEKRMIEEAKNQAKQKAAEEVRALYEQRHQREREEMKMREAELLALLEKERREREERERILLQQQQEKETLIRQQEEKRIAAALEIYRAQESARMRQNITEEVRLQEERRIREEYQEKFKQEAEARQQEYRRETEELHQRDEFFDCNWKLSHSELEYGQPIGQGAFGEVYKGKLHGKEVAIKRLLVQNVSEISLQEFKQEIAIMSNLRHPNLLLFIGACLEPQHIAIVTEYLPMGSLQDVLFAKNVHMDMKKRLTILKEVAQGMNWLHSLKPPFLHRDLKTGNILLDQHLSARISDFGLASVKRLDENGQRVEGPVGSPFYMAPEILLDKPYDTKADVYSFSIVIWETLAHKDPYEGEFETYEEMVEGITMDGMRPEILPWFPVGIVALLEQCWDTIPENRPSFAQILQQSWFDHILVDYCIPNSPLANQFWKIHFLEKVEVSVDDFLNTLRIFCGVNYPNDHPYLKLWQFLVARASNNGLLNVNISDFECAVSWYGPMQQPMELLTRVYQYACNPWFYGLVQPPDTLLQSQNAGAWYIVQNQLKDDLLREYKLSFKDMKTNSVAHVLFCQDAQGIFYFNNQSFPEWNALLEFMQSYCAFNKSTPCSGSPFAFLTQHTP